MMLFNTFELWTFTSENSKDTLQPLNICFNGRANLKRLRHKNNKYLLNNRAEVLIHNEQGINQHFKQNFCAITGCLLLQIIHTKMRLTCSYCTLYTYSVYIHLTFLQFHRLMFSTLQTKHQGFKIMTSVNNKNTCIFHRWLHVQKYYKSHSMQNPQAWSLNRFTVTPPKKYGFTQGKFIIINIIHMQENLTMRPYCSAHSLPEKTTTTSEVTSQSNTPHNSHFPVRNPSTDWHNPVHRLKIKTKVNYISE